jgi:outer membrane protein
MRNLFSKLTLGIVVSMLVSGPAMAQTRIGTVDLRKIFDNYWKTKQATQVLEERKKDMEKEDNNMKDDLKKGAKDFDELQATVSDQAVSQEERDKRKKAAEEKLKSLNELKTTIDQYERQARATLSEQSTRMRANILVEIKNVVNAKAKTAGFFMVVDTAAESANNTPVVVYSTTDNDVTDSVLAQLNATQPADAKFDDKPVDKKEDKKDDKKADKK